MSRPYRPVKKKVIKKIEQTPLRWKYLIESKLSNNCKLEAVKLMRTYTGLDLFTSKDVIDVIKEDKTYDWTEADKLLKRFGKHD